MNDTTLYKKAKVDSLLAQVATDIANLPKTAVGVTYNNTLSGMIAGNVQAAIDELKGDIASVGGAQLQSDWLQTITTAKDYIKNKPVIPAAQVQSDWNATSGVSAIANKPQIVAQVNADWSVNSGVAQILNKPSIPSTPGGVGLGNVTNNLQVKAPSTGKGETATRTLTSGGGFKVLNIGATGDVTEYTMTLPTIPTIPALTAGYVLKAGDSNTTLEAGLIKNINIASAAGIALNKLATVTASKLIGSDTSGFLEAKPVTIGSSAISPDTTNSISLGVTANRFSTGFFTSKINIGAASTDTTYIQTATTDELKLYGSTAAQLQNSTFIAELRGASFQPTTASRNLGSDTSTNRWGNIYFSGSLVKAGTTVTLCTMSVAGTTLTITTL